MEYIFLDEEGRCVGGVKILDSGEIKVNVPLASIYWRGIEFPTRTEWTSDSLSQFLNEYGKIKGGERFKHVKAVKAQVPAGHFHPRIARPSEVVAEIRTSV